MSFSLPCLPALCICLNSLPLFEVVAAEGDGADSQRNIMTFSPVQWHTEAIIYPGHMNFGQPPMTTLFSIKVMI